MLTKSNDLVQLQCTILYFIFSYFSFWVELLESNLCSTHRAQYPILEYQFRPPHYELVTPENLKHHCCLGLSTKALVYGDSSLQAYRPTTDPFMMTEPNASERSQDLVAINRQKTRNLYGSRDSGLSQIPPSRADDDYIDLGLRVSYRSAASSGKIQKRQRQKGTTSITSRETTQLAIEGGGQSAVPANNVVSVNEKKVEVGQGDTRKNSAASVGADDKERGAGNENDGILVEYQDSALNSTFRKGKQWTKSLAEDKPSWHPPWKMYRGISGHLGWVRSVAVDVSNEWFATGSADRTIKIWDLPSGRLRLTLTGHISTVRGIAISERHPYMFTVGEDKTVKCWDLEQNKVIRNYHGHLSGVYCVSLHPTLDVLMTGGRDSTVRVWDIRTRAQIFVLGGHRDTVNALFTQEVDPQIVSSSVDSTVRLWDLAAGKCSGILTNHRKGVRALARHPREFSFASASADNIKTWALPDGNFMRNLSDQRQEKLVNALAVNQDGVLVSGGDDGSIGFWDYAGAHCFQTAQTIVQPGSLDCEAGIYAVSFDRSGSRLITCEADKTIKMWKEDDSATEETHPLNWEPPSRRQRY